MEPQIVLLKNYEQRAFQQAQPPLISLYFPTDQASGAAQRIQLKDLLLQAQHQLQKHVGKHQESDVSDMFRALLERLPSLTMGWPDGGAAVLACRRQAYVYRLSYKVRPEVVVGEHFYMRPLVENFQWGAQYILLCLSFNSFALLEGSFSDITHRALGEVPAALSPLYQAFNKMPEALGSNFLENRLAPYHWWKRRNNLKKEEAEKFFYHVSRTLTQYVLQGNSLPVILVTLPQHEAAFRQVSEVPHLLNEGISKDPEGLDKQELLQLSVQVIAHARQQRVTRLLGEYGDDAAHGAASSNLNEVGLALVERRVRALFLERDGFVPGSFDAESGVVCEAADAQSVSDMQGLNACSGRDVRELGDAFAQAALEQDAEVINLNSDQMPGHSGVAALFRF